METKEIIASLEYFTKKFPREALKEAINRKDEIVPVLLDALETARNDIKLILDDETYYLPMYAVYLLAQFREKKAYPLVADLVSPPGEIAFDLFGDVITEDLGKILASLSCGDTSLINQLIENPGLNEFVRSAALEALLVLVARGEKTRIEIVDYFRTLFHGALEKEYSYVWGKLVSCCYYLHPEELYDEIEQTYATGMADSGLIGFEDIKAAMQRPKENTVDFLNSHNRYGLIEDTIGRLEHWACFDSGKKKSSPEINDVQTEDLIEALQLAIPGDTGNATIVRDTKKIGRNEPCPCGSGKKYKRCCGA